MRLRPLVYAIGACAATLALSAEARAQFQLTSATSPTLETLSTGMGRQIALQGLASGLKLGDSAILHAGLYADIGYDTNVFYAQEDGEKSSPVLHVGPRLELNNAERDGTRPSVYYDLFAALDWRKYLSDEEAVTEHDAINPSLGGILELGGGQSLSLLLTESFVRYQQAPYTQGSPIVRDINMASASVRFAPGGGRLKLTLRYANILDIYEDEYSVGSNMGNELVLDAGWRWLPKTSLYVQVAQGVINYFEGDRPSSYPLRTLAGLRGLLTSKLSVNLAAGYYNAFYSEGEGPSGFGNVGIVGELNYQIDLLSRFGIGYRHDFANSPFVGQFYNVDAVYAAYQQMVASRVIAYLYGRYENRRFGGLGAGASRTDNYVMGGVAVDYLIGKVFLLGANYTIGANRVEESGGATGGVEYTKQTILFRLGVTY